MPVAPHARHVADRPQQLRRTAPPCTTPGSSRTRHIRHSLEGGFYQGWDLHPAQLPVRYAACYAFFLEGFAPAAERLRNFVEKAAQATLVGDVFDDAATGQGLLNYFLRALNSGAIEVADLERTGLTPEEVELRSFAKILARTAGTPQRRLTTPGRAARSPRRGPRLRARSARSRPELRARAARCRP